MKTWSIILIALTVTACAGTNTYQTDYRPMNKSEKTLVSDDVREVVEASDGQIDIRNHPNIKCKRIKLVGSHIHQRLCYTNEEEKKLAEENAARYYARFGLQKCLDSGSAACQNGLDEPAGLQ